MKRRMLTLGVLILAVALVIACNETSKQQGEESPASEPTSQSSSEQPAQSESGWVTTNSGLKYLDHVIGIGEEAVKGMTVEMHYTGWLWENGQRGKKFDSSHDRNQPFQFQLGAGQVIQGWDEGILGIKVGGKRELIIPPELGYGPRPVGGGLIPANSTLNFDVEFLGVVSK